MSSGLLQLFVESGNFMELQTTSFIESMGVTYSDSEDWTSLQASNNTGITKSEQVTPVDSIKDIVQSSVKVPEFNKQLKKAGGHIGRNIVEITIKMKTIVRKPLMIKINKLRLRN